MRKLYLANTCCLLPALLLAGCDFSGNDLPPVVNEPDPNSTTETIPETPATTIDLTLSPAILETMQQQEKDFLAPAETLPTSVINSPTKDDVRFSGKLHLDKSDDKEYLDAIDGGEINVELKLR